MDDVSREIERKLELMEEEISKDPERFTEPPKMNSVFGAFYRDRGDGWVEVSGSSYARTTGTIALRSGDTTTFGSTYYCSSP